MFELGQTMLVLIHCLYFWILEFPLLDFAILSKHILGLPCIRRYCVITNTLSLCKQVTSFEVFSQLFETSNALNLISENRLFVYKRHRDLMDFHENRNMFQMRYCQTPQELRTATAVDRSCGILPLAHDIESAVHHPGVRFIPDMCVCVHRRR